MWAESEQEKTRQDVMLPWSRMTERHISGSISQLQFVKLGCVPFLYDMQDYRRHKQVCSPRPRMIPDPVSVVVQAAISAHSVIASRHVER
jgi:hypothetical protein